MKRAFTLIELLTVMMIMGLMGTAAVGGYRAMQRGMEERGAVQSVNAMVRAAYQRAQIDRLPTVVFFWNETIRSRSEEEHEIVVGRAVAVRRHGRFSNVIGSHLIDEFADLNRSYPTAEDESEGSDKDGIYIYPMDKASDLTSNSSLKRSVVRTQVYRVSENQDVRYLSDTPAVSEVGTQKDDDDKLTKPPSWAFRVIGAGGVQWKPGMAYGFEFIRLELPAGYVFGDSVSSSVDDPVRTAGTLVFTPKSGSGGGIVGRKTVPIHSLRAKGAELECTKVADTDSPEDDL